MGTRTDRTKLIKDLDVSRLKMALNGEGCVVGIDVAKTTFFASVMDLNRRVHALAVVSANSRGRRSHRPPVTVGAGLKRLPMNLASRDLSCPARLCVVIASCRGALERPIL